MASEWKTGLFGCFDHTASCFDVCCCYCFQIGRQCEAVKGNVDANDTVMCCVAVLLSECGAPLIQACQIRSKVVEKYQIDEGFLGGCLKSCCCAACSLCQTHRELAVRGANPGGCICVKEPFSMK